jgi:hypothetical protein
MDPEQLAKLEQLSGMGDPEATERLARYRQRHLHLPRLAQPTAMQAITLGSGSWQMPENMTEGVVLLLQEGCREVHLTSTPTIGQRILVKDVSGVASENHITVFGAGNLVEGQESSRISESYGARDLLYAGQHGWLIS